MCPLRVILIFLSATLAGFFVLRNLKSHPQQQPADIDPNDSPMSQNSHSFTPPMNRSSKFRSAMESGFWTCVDMASGRYLWRHLVSSSSKKSS